MVCQRYLKPISNDTLIAQLQHLSQKLGKVPTAADVQLYPGISTKETFRDHFGSHNNALRAAGLKVNRVRYTKEQLDKALRDCANSMGGKAPTPGEYSQYREKRLRTGNEHFPTKSPLSKQYGSWSKALVEVLGAHGHRRTCKSTKNKHAKINRLSTVS